MDRIKNFILQKVPAIRRIVSERDQLIKERAEPKKRISRILTEKEVEYYKEKIEEYGERIGWYQSMDLGNGLFTTGATVAGTIREGLEKRITSLQIPDDLTGMTFLDVGSWDGYYAFEAEARGASRVMATWGGGGWGKKDGFLLAREILGSKVEDKNIEVQDISPATVGMWDIVLFSGIFYHMRDPIQAMQAAASVASKCMIVETHIEHDKMSQPIMRYVPRLRDNETSNYWRPNSAMILVLLKEMGFNRVEHRIAIDPPGGADSTHGFFNAYRR